MLRLTQAAREKMPFTGATPGCDRAGHCPHCASRSAIRNDDGNKQVVLLLPQVQAAEAAALLSCLGCKVAWQLSACPPCRSMSATQQSVGQGAKRLAANPMDRTERPSTIHEVAMQPIGSGTNRTAVPRVVCAGASWSSAVHRSISPNTTSRVPIMVTTSASMAPVATASSICRWA